MQETKRHNFEHLLN